MLSYVNYDLYVVLLEPTFAPSSTTLRPSVRRSDQQQSCLDGGGTAIECETMEMRLKTKEEVFLANVHLLTIEKLHKGNSGRINWMAVCLEGGESAFGVYALTQIMTLNSNLTLELPVAVIHLNHEEPWKDLRAKFPLDDSSLHHYGDESPSIIDAKCEQVSALCQAYSMLSLVIRNYYLRDDACCNDHNNVLLLPLGPSYFNYVVNTHHFVSGQGVGGLITTRKYLRASERMTLRNFCYFSGRLEYTVIDDENTIHSNSGSNRYEKAKSFRATSSQRVELGNAIMRARSMEELHQGLGTCTFSSSSSSDAQQQHQYTADDAQYREYLRTLAHTLFLPAPAGNNIETFRFYEILEVGGIPVVVAEEQLYENRTSLDHMYYHSGTNVSRLESAENNPFHRGSAGLFYDLNAEYCLGCYRSDVGTEAEIKDCDYPGPVFSSWWEAHCYMSLFTSTADMLVSTKVDPICDKSKLVQRIRRTIKKEQDTAISKAKHDYVDSLQLNLVRWYTMRKCVAKTELTKRLEHEYSV
jgi:hypothetical protein